MNKSVKLLGNAIDWAIKDPPDFAKPNKRHAAKVGRILQLPKINAAIAKNPYPI